MTGLFAPLPSTYMPSITNAQLWTLGTGLLRSDLRNWRGGV